jgi:hypothetical protein
MPPRLRPGIRPERGEKRMPSSRERVEAALGHREADRVPLDLGGFPVTGMHVSSVYLLRQALALDPPGTPVKVVEPFQMLGEIAPDLVDALGVDVLPLSGPTTMFGFRNEGWKEWRFRETPVLVPEGFNTEPDASGDLYLYPEGDRSVPPSGKMPRGGYYFDAVPRQPPIDEARLDPADNLEEFTAVSDETLDHYAREVDRLSSTGKAIAANFGGTAFGDIALVPGLQLKHPKGVRDVEEWYVSTVSRRPYVSRVFEKQCGIGLANLERIHRVVGDAVTAVFVTGTDFGTQRGPFISPKAYRELFQPFHTEVNAWIHHHTRWRSFIHSCGSVRALVPYFLEAGFDILNPVQCSAAEMDARELKEEFGERVTFWGGGVDTQKTLPFGTPDDVRREVRERLRIFGTGGGYVFNTVHNVQARVPVENLLALYETIREAGVYPME